MHLVYQLTSTIFQQCSQTYDYKWALSLRKDVYEHHRIKELHLSPFFLELKQLWFKILFFAVTVIIYDK